MQFIPAICPQCSGKLQVPEGKDSVQCEFCGTDVFLRESEKTAASKVVHLLELAQAAETAGNHTEAFGYFTSVLEIDSKNVWAWVGKGTSAGYLSTLAHSRIPETIECYRTAVRLAGDDDAITTVVSMDCAVAAVLIANAYFQTSLQHTMQFISVPDTPYEHATRCVEAVKLCEFALSLDPNVPGAASFIHDVASRTLNVGKLSADEKAFLEGERSKHASAAPKPATTGPAVAGTDAGSTGVMVGVFGAAYVASYFILKAMGVQTTFWALFWALWLCIPIGGAVGIGCILAMAKFAHKKT
ncbi:hypothetical protein [Comamonas granuli]|uniref:hypothetical protein n=1 Tax=Comamonas granuli TaxID=290309 RepID=UPI0012EC249A|nr:hypothetical protein [Comamonas granuli]